jgi:hypothetical protein
LIAATGARRSLCRRTTLPSLRGTACTTCRPHGPEAGSVKPLPVLSSYSWQRYAPPMARKHAPHCVACQHGTCRTTWHVPHNMARAAQHGTCRTTWHVAYNMARGVQHGTWRTTWHVPYNMARGIQQTAPGNGGGEAPATYEHRCNSLSASCSGTYRHANGARSGRARAPVAGRRPRSRHRASRSSTSARSLTAQRTRPHSRRVALARAVSACPHGAVRAFSHGRSMQTVRCNGSQR